MTRKRALVTGITGQDGSYLAEFLLEKGYEVHGIKRRASLFNTQRVDHIYEDPHEHDQQFVLHYGDLTDTSNLTRILAEVQPDEVYNLGAQSHVAVSFEAPEYTADVDAIGTLRLLEAIRFLGLTEKTASTRPPPRSCSARCKRPRSARPRRSTRAAPTRPPSSTPTGSPSTTARPTACTPATASSSTTRARAAARPSSPARSPAPWPTSPKASSTACISATWMPCATGATPKTTCACNG